MSWLAFSLGGSLGGSDAMQMAIQPGSHNTILVSSRPGRRTGGSDRKNPFAPA
jgi:hypothetical protein